ncbi:unnamed protein product [Auanema sp. JU1783]|nr:unnamed protein product [Auanema sp. JU1783]
MYYGIAGKQSHRRYGMLVPWVFVVLKRENRASHMIPSVGIEGMLLTVSAPRIFSSKKLLAQFPDDKLQYLDPNCWRH